MPTYSALLAAEGPGGLFATLDSTRLIVRCAETKTLLRNIELDSKLVANVRQLRWFHSDEPEDAENPTQRLLLATSENIHVYDVRNPRWKADIKKACGEGGKIVSADFGAHKDEILAFSAFGLKSCVWSLTTGSSTEIEDVKTPSTRSYSLRKSTGHIALLTRAGAKDALTVLSPDRKDVEFSTALPTTDAQGISWSHNGVWLVVWDTATAGTGVAIYTATGQLFKKFGGGDSEDLGYGVQRVQWDPEDRFLVVVLNDRRCVFLKTGVFTPHMVFEYPSKFASQHAQIHQEQIAEDGTRSYALSSQHIHEPPSIPSALGFNFVAISPSSNLFASVLASQPTTVWIHSFHPNPQLTAVIIHHGSVKSISWHPSIPGLLLSHCSATGSDQKVTNASSPVPNPHIYFWGYDHAEPKIINVPAAKSSDITKTMWLRSFSEPRALISTAATCSTIGVLLDDDDEEEEDVEFPTPKPVPQQKQKYSVAATPTQVLGYNGMTTPMTTASNFSPIKMDTAQLTKTLGFQFTSLDDSESNDTFAFKLRT